PQSVHGCACCILMIYEWSPVYLLVRLSSMTNRKNGQASATLKNNGQASATVKKNGHAGAKVQGNGLAGGASFDLHALLYGLQAMSDGNFSVRLRSEERSVGKECRC